jgi:DNA-binding transcriptional LysR family regulator
MRAVTMRTGALGRLELITKIPGHDSLAAAARALYGRRSGAFQQMVRKIEIAAGFTIVDRSSLPLAPTADGREFIREAFQVLRIAQAAEAADKRVKNLAARCPERGACQNPGKSWRQPPSSSHPERWPSPEWPCQL